MSAIPTSGFKGTSYRLRSFPGVEAMHVRHECRCCAEHAHDWPCLIIPLTGSANEAFEGGDVLLSGPAAVYHSPESPHTSNIDGRGQDALGIFFDPGWLGIEGACPPLNRSRGWQGGIGGAMARRLARAWMRPDVSEASLRRAMVRLLAVRQRASVMPTWLPEIQQAITRDGTRSTTELARRVGVQPAWLARAYRNATGQGLQEFLRSVRLENAVHELRTTDRPLIEIALAAGFCDQSHLHRWSVTLLGRTPGQLRAQAAGKQPPGAARRNHRNVQSNPVHCD